MRGKKMLCLLLTLFWLLPVLTVPAFADTGPKPSVVVRFDYDADLWARAGRLEYYATLLAKQESTGPYSWVKPDEDPELFYYAKNAEAAGEEVWQAFVNYQDPDAYHFLGFVQKCSGPDSLVWNYYPPEQFKLLVYFPEVKAFESSLEPVERYAFDSYYTAREELGGEPHFVMERDHGFGQQAAGFLFRLVLTIGLELLIALVFGFWRRKQLLMILIVNCVTQLALNIGMQAAGVEPIFFVYVIRYGIWELAIMAAEASAYTVAWRRFAVQDGTEPGGWGRPAIYAITANLLSFWTGYLLSGLLRFLF